MGSGGTRKNNDSVRINLPTERKNGSGGSSGGSSGSSRDINNVCPPAFEVAINPSKPLPDGTTVSIKDDALLARGEVIGKLSSKYVRTIEECAGEGIRYAGRVLNKENGKVYAHFEQQV